MRSSVDHDLPLHWPPPFHVKASKHGPRANSFTRLAIYPLGTGGMSPEGFSPLKILLIPWYLWTAYTHRTWRSTTWYPSLFRESLSSYSAFILIVKLGEEGHMLRSVWLSWLCKEAQKKSKAKCLLPVCNNIRTAYLKASSDFLLLCLCQITPWCI